MSPQVPPASKPTRRPSRGERFRSWAASCALLALAWPSLGVLPWIAVEWEKHSRVARADGDLGATSEWPAGHRRADASRIPGSPTHPADHDCFQCQVLKHLSRCALLPPGIPEVLLGTGSALEPPARADAARAGYGALLPPVRAPPSRHA